MPPQIKGKRKKPKRLTLRKGRGGGKPKCRELPKGFHPIRRIIGKAVVKSRIKYCIDWDIPKDTKRNWIDYLAMNFSIPTLKQYDTQYNTSEEYPKFIKREVPKINPKSVASQRKYLEDIEIVARIVAYERKSGQVIIYWENGNISAVKLSTIDDIPLRRALGAMLLKENKWVLEHRLGGLAGHPVKLGDDEEDPENDDFDEEVEGVTKEGLCYEVFNWEHFYEGIFDEFPQQISKNWDYPVGDRGRRIRAQFEVIFNPTFPARESDEEEHDPSLSTINHTICANCGIVYEAPNRDLVMHILTTGHIGWFFSCYVKNEELERSKLSLTGPLVDPDELSPDDKKKPASEAKVKGEAQMKVSA